MKALIKKLTRSKLYEMIPADNLLDRQRFELFRIFSFTGFMVCTMVFIQMISTLSQIGFIPWAIFGLSLMMMANYFAVKRPGQLRKAYIVALSAAFLLLHLQSYTAGGIINSGTIYLCVVILCSFMLIGKNAGLIMSALAAVHLLYLYAITSFTTITSTALFNNEKDLINQDFLITGILGIILVAAQASNLLGSKNIIIQRITESRNELRKKNEELKEYTENLEKTNKELDKFASIVSHDLKAPLRAIGNLTGWIEEDAGDKFDEETRKNFNIIKGRVKRMEDLINAILEYSKADKVKGELLLVDVDKLVHETIEFIGKPDNAEVVIERKLPSAFAEQVKLEQVFSNLISNAIKYNDKQDIKVNVSFTEDDQYYTFSVKDNGPGIDPKYHEKIFIIFQTLNRRDDVESTGVGLAIVKKIIEEQGGKIWVESEVGQGAIFKFNWPVPGNNVKNGAIAA
jgi:signal transduction histidine kinase